MNPFWAGDKVKARGCGVCREWSSFVAELEIDHLITEKEEFWVLLVVVRGVWD
jgi:hypothetical protein